MFVCSVTGDSNYGTVFYVSAEHKCIHNNPYIHIVKGDGREIVRNR